MEWLRWRHGALLVFLARILQDGWAKRARAIAVEENAAVLIGADGRATVVGFGPAYFLEANTLPAGCKDKVPLTCRNISVHVAVTGSTFDVKNWKGEGGDDYALSVKRRSSERRGIFARRFLMVSNQISENDAAVNVNAGL
jgi:cyanophycinase-like exopeptidase